MDVYADLYFLINFSMDYLCLWLTSCILHRPLYFRRGFAASALGGVYAVCMLFPSLPFAIGLLFDAACCVLLCTVAFYNRHEKFSAYPRLSCVYFLISALLGGLMTALYTLLNRIPGLLDRVEEDGVSVWIFFLLAGVSALFSHLFGRVLSRRTAQHTARIEVAVNGAVRVLTGLWDSGNLLCDPLSGRAVVPVECSCLAGLLPDRVLRATADTAPGALAALPAETVKSLRLRLLPVRTASGDSLALGWIPDSVYLLDGNEKRPLDVVLCPLSLSDPADKYHPEVLLPACLCSQVKSKKGRSVL